MTFHLHIYEPILKDVEAWRMVSYHKEYTESGMIIACRCSSMRFVPNDRRLRSVAVTLERRKENL